MSVSSGNRRLIRVLLLSNRLVREAAETEPTGETKSFSYSVAMESIQRREDYIFAFVSLKAEEKIADANSVQFSALYLFGVRGEPFPSEEAEFEFLTNAIETLVWPRFRDLCELTVSQAELDFPRLPTTPDSIGRPKAKEE